MNKTTHSQPAARRPLTALATLTISSLLALHAHAFTGNLTSLSGWYGSRGFSGTNVSGDSTGVGWFSVNDANRYQGVYAPGALDDYAVCEGLESSDHCQLAGPDAYHHVLATDAVPQIQCFVDMKVCFADNGTANSDSTLNCFYQIFEKVYAADGTNSWNPAVGVFRQKTSAGGWLSIGPWGNDAIFNGQNGHPAVQLVEKQWYRIKIDFTLRTDGAQTRLNAWRIAADGTETSIVTNVYTSHPTGLTHSGTKRDFPTRVGSYTWGPNPLDVATLICAYWQDDDQTR